MSENKKLNDMETENVSGGKGIVPDKVVVRTCMWCKCKNCGKGYLEDFDPDGKGKETYCKNCREKLGLNYREILSKKM